ncbi:transposase [Planctomycetes bacterium CA13]|uniref:transposase n=1 Tax=Novipirellula herctigrandis TaxID=2527986 RepID=UPI0011B3DCAA
MQRGDLKTGRAWAIKESFLDFWTYVDAYSAEDFFERWCGWEIRSRLEPIKKVGRILKSHMDGLLSDFRYRFTNAVAEGFNSRTKSNRSEARGFRTFKSYRLRILFFCSKLEMMPNTCH